MITVSLWWRGAPASFTATRGSPSSRPFLRVERRGRLALGERPHRPGRAGPPSSAAPHLPRTRKRRAGTGDHRRFAGRELAEPTVRRPGVPGLVVRDPDVRAAVLQGPAWPPGQGRLSGDRPGGSDGRGLWRRSEGRARRRGRRPRSRRRSRGVWRAGPGRPARYPPRAGRAAGRRARPGWPGRSPGQRAGLQRPGHRPYRGRGLSAGWCRMAGRCRHQASEVGELGVADARYLAEFVDGSEPAVLGSVVDDALRQHRADAGQLVELRPRWRS